MADTYLNYTGKLIKLIDQNDGTYAIAAELTPGAVNIGEVTLDEGHKYAGQMAVVLLKGVTTTGGVGSITDDSKDIPAGLLAGKYIKVNINGIEYVREILQNSGNAITFKDILAAASAVNVYGEASGGQVTTVVDEVGAAGNGYTIEFIAALTNGASTEAVKDGKAITVTLGTNSDGVKAGASIGTGTDGVVDILVDAVGVAGNAYSIEVVLSEEADAGMTATLSGKKITVTLGTDGDGLIDAAKNAAILVAAAINDLEGFTAIASGDGSAPLAIEAEKPFMGGSDPTVNATGAAVAAAINALPGVSASMTGSGGVVAAGQGTFSGGLDEIAVPALAEYEIIDLASGTVEAPIDVQLSGSNIPNTQAVPNRQQNKVVISTILNAVSVPVYDAEDLIGTTVTANYTPDGASEIYLAVNIDKQPWSANAMTWTGYSGSEGQRTYPFLKDITHTSTNSHNYKLALIYSELNPIETVDSYEKALRAAYYPETEGIVRIWNKHATDVATVTIKMIKVWRNR